MKKFLIAPLLALTLASAPVAAADFTYELITDPGDLIGTTLTGTVVFDMASEGLPVPDLDSGLVVSLSITSSLEGGITWELANCGNVFSDFLGVVGDPMLEPTVDLEWLCVKDFEGGLDMGAGFFGPDDGNEWAVDGFVDFDEGLTPPTPRWKLVLVTPATAVSQLLAAVVGLNLQSGIENSLDGKLDAVLKALEDVNQNNDAAAIGSLNAFINAVVAQSGKQISEQDALELIAKAQAVIDMLSGP